MKKFKKNNIRNSISGSKGVDIEEIDASSAETDKLIETLMQTLMGSQMFEEELKALADKPITMLLPQGDKKRFFLFSPVLNMYRDVGAPVEVTVMEESNGKETLCLINNVPYLVPNEYLKNVGYN